MTTENQDPTSDTGAPAPAVEPTPELATTLVPADPPDAEPAEAEIEETAEVPFALIPGNALAEPSDSAEIPAETSPQNEAPVEAPSAEAQPPADPAPAAPAPSRRQLGADYRSERRFVDFPISSEVLAGLEALGYDHATPIQARSIEPALAGKDLLLRAKTGTGKTAAFGVPVIDRIPAGHRKPRALILAPTRELALQVAQELTGIARFKDIGVCAIYGGVGFGPQEQALRDGVEIVVGTPGRLLDHVKRGHLKLETVDHVVLDEADEMLSMGFVEDVRKLLDRTAPVRQAIFCSATLNEQVRGLIDRYTKEPEEILLSSDGDNVDLVQHLLFESSPDYHKARALLDVIEMVRPTSAIIFCNTKEDVSTVYNYLDRQGLSAEMLTGDLPQSRRERVMARIKASAVQYLIATDVAARGIDISDLSHVINYALPDDAAVYTHRAGRTGRIGKKGVCISLAGGADFSSRLSLERIHKIKFEVRPLPTAEESTNLRTDRLVRMLKEAMNTMVYESYLELVKKVRERTDGDHILAAAMRAFVMWDRDRRITAADAALGEDAGNEGGFERRREEPRRDDRRRDEPRRDEARRDEPRRDEPRRDEPRREDRRRDDDRRDERRRDDRPRDDRSREDRPREDRPREDRPREDRPREDRPRDDRPRDGERRRNDRGERRDGDRPRRDAEPRREPTTSETPPAPAEINAEGVSVEAASTETSTEPRREERRERRDRRDRRDRPRGERRPEGAPEGANADGVNAESANAEPAGDAGRSEGEAGELRAEGAPSAEGDEGREASRRPRRRRRRRSDGAPGGEGSSGGEGEGAPGVDAPSGGSDAAEDG